MKSGGRKKFFINEIFYIIYDNLNINSGVYNIL
jgi:hypothetical protein